MSKEKKPKKQHISKADVPAKKNLERRHWRTDPYGKKVKNLLPIDWTVKNI